MGNKWCGYLQVLGKGVDHRAIRPDWLHDVDHGHTGSKIKHYNSQWEQQFNYFL
jgi:hypothetical protein